MALSQKRYFRKLAVLAKIEADYGADAAPTGAANAIQMTEVSVTPLAGGEVSRDLLLPYLGQQGVELVGTYVTLEGSVELAGASAAGTVPAYGVLLRACGLAETVTVGTSVEYDPVSSGFEAATLYYNRDGVRHIMLGARGTFVISMSPSQIPRMRFTFTGLAGTISDAPLPGVDLSAFVRALVVTKANTTMALHGWTAVAEQLTVTLGNQVEPRFLIGEESIQIVDRQMTGSIVVEAKSLETVNWFDIAKARTRAPAAITHGTIAGNIVELEMPAVEVGRPTEGETQKILNYTLPLMPCPVSGDDEFKMTVR